MQTTIDVTPKDQSHDLPAMPHEQKRALIKRAIELNADEDIWLTYSEIAEITGLHRKEVRATMYGSGKCFLESSWRMRNGEIMVTIRDLYEKRTSLFAKVVAAFTGQRD